jgi:ubiquinone/menaquinone biosynthesis C-methylase UbiE
MVPSVTTGSRAAKISGFSAVDQTADPDFYVRFMEQGHRLPDIVSARLVATSRLGLRPGDRVLDVGCGPALDVAELAAEIGSAGEYVGVDMSETMIAAARRRAAPLETPTHFEVASAYELPFDDGSFDACRTDRLLMHLTEPETALAQMYRVTRRGGRICVVDFDWHTMLLHHPDQSATESLLRGFSDDFADGRIGRRLSWMFAGTGLPLAEITLHPVHFTPAFLELLLGGYLAKCQADGVLTAEHLEQWWQQLKVPVDEGTFFASVTSFVASATKSATRPRRRLAPVRQPVDGAS